MLGQLPQHLAISAMNLAVQLYIHVLSLLLCVLWLGRVQFVSSVVFN